jgi:hypothetical protein
MIVFCTWKGMYAWGVYVFLCEFVCVCVCVCMSVRVGVRGCTCEWVRI